MQLQLVVVVVEFSRLSLALFFVVVALSSVNRFPVAPWLHNSKYTEDNCSIFS